VRIRVRIWRSRPEAPRRPTGATEARAAEADDAGIRALFGEEAFSAALAGCHGLTAAGIVERLGQTLAQHSGARASDNTALLALRVPPLAPADR
jgi:serine phosphatase RsbU (regulator of sigma subunit)